MRLIVTEKNNSAKKIAEIRVGEWLHVHHPSRGGQWLNIAFTIATALLLIQLRAPTETDTHSNSPSASLGRPAANQLTLKLCQPAQYRQHQPAVRRRGVCPHIA